MPTVNGATGPASFPSSVNFSEVCAAAKSDTSSSVTKIAAATTSALFRKRDSPTKAIVAVPAGKTSVRIRLLVVMPSDRPFVNNKGPSGHQSVYSREQ